MGSILNPRELSFSALHSNEHDEQRSEENDEFFDEEDDIVATCPSFGCFLGTCVLRSGPTIAPKRAAVPKRDVDKEKVQLLDDSCEIWMGMTELPYLNGFCRSNRRHGCQFKATLKQLKDHCKSCRKFVMQCKTCGRENVEREKVWRQERLTSFSREYADDMKSYLLAHPSLPRLVKDYSYELQSKISDALDPDKRNRNDWRIVASRLQFSHLIRGWERMESPTIELLRECTETTSKQFLEVLMDVERTDVFEKIYNYVSKQGSLPRPKYPTQESLAGGSRPCSTLSRPVQEFGSASYLVTSDDTSCRPQQESKKTGIGFGISIDESEKFWINIAGDYNRKSCKDFFEAATSYCPKEMQQGHVENFMRKVLNTDYGQSYISLKKFNALVDLFGPFKPGPDGCLKKIYDLMDTSTSVQNGTKESCFANQMNDTDAENFHIDQFSRHFGSQAFR